MKKIKLLDSEKVLNQRLNDEGFKSEYETLEEELKLAMPLVFNHIFNLNDK